MKTINTPEGKKKYFSLNHVSIGTRWSGSFNVSDEDESSWWDEVPQEWLDSAEIGDTFDLGGGVYVERVWE